ncbi:MAG: hypothetical protein OEW19_08660 [Acidobacteriota bacterium]|nr:hypothetical protein [Acidobacteriota bacterium]
MTPDDPTPGPPPATDDADTGEPIGELRGLSLTVDERFRGRVRGRIERRLLAGDLAGLLWTSPVLVAIEFLRVSFELFGGRKRP